MSRVHNDSNKNPKVLKSFTIPTGLVPKTSVAIDGSTKCLFEDVLIALLDLIAGNHAGWSSITKILLNAFK